MGGGLIQIVTYGTQDIYLTGNPQITFFKVVYKRHTNFSIESIEQTFNGALTFGSTTTCELSRNGDLINKMYLQVELPALAQAVNNGSNSTFVHWVNGVGNAIIKKLDLLIGGLLIDSHYAEWLDIWSELNIGSDQKSAYNEMVGYYNSTIGMQNNATSSSRYYVPLQFFFNRNPGLALPLIALQYHDVRVEFEFAPLADVHIGTANGHSLDNATLLVDYIYLDSEERKRFAQASHEYLIEQLQYTGAESITGTSGKYRLNFNHPCKELVWAATACATDTSVTKSTNFGNATTRAAGSNPVKTAQLQLNGHDRFSTQSGKYFNFLQPRVHHRNTPIDGVNVYSFALNPEEHQPSGTCNFSRIDNAQLNIEFVADYSTNGKIHIFATSYNVLIIMSGMGGLAYSN